jgi:hypothetical protein
MIERFGDGGDLRELWIRGLHRPARRKDRGVARDRRPRQEYELGNRHRVAERPIPAAMRAVRPLLAGRNALLGPGTAYERASGGYLS